MPATREFWGCASLRTFTLSGQDSGLDIGARPHALSLSINNNNNNKVNMSDIAALEADIKEYKLQLETVQLGLQADSDSQELKELQTELEEAISLTQATIDELKPASAPPPKQAPAPVATPKWSMKDHPAYQKTALPQSPAEDSSSSSTFAVNDMVLAKWHSGDKGFYPARITSITGSSTAPVYIVKFKSYDTTETLRSKDIKPIVNPNKRKADGPPDMSSASSAPQVNTSVISAAANINEELAQKSKKEPSMVGDGPTRPAKVPKKIKNKTELETGKKNWQEFASKGKFGKAAKKESMFRTPEGVNGRVGFTGSGQSMRKDATRTKHIYSTATDEESYQ